MTLKKQIQVWLVASIVFALLLYVFSPILLPFIAGLAVAYLLDPLVDGLEQLGLNRLLSVLVIVFSFMLVLIIVLILLLPLIGHQISTLLAALPSLVSMLQGLASKISYEQMAGLLGISVGDLQTGVSQLVQTSAQWVGAVLASVLGSGQAFLSIVAVLMITPVVAFYLLYDWDRIIAAVDDWLPRDHADTVRMLVKEMDSAVAGFVRGQISVGAILGLFYAITLTLIGLPFSLIIGFGAGLISFIPYVGSVLGLAVSVGVATFEFWPEWHWIAVTAIIFGVGQFLEGNILQPFLIGTRVQLHPVWLIFALFAFGYLFGFVGTLIAVPVAAIAGVLVRFVLAQYLSSKLYLGEALQKEKSDA